MAGLRECKLAHCHVDIGGHYGFAEEPVDALYLYENPKKIGEATW